MHIEFGRRKAIVSMEMLINVKGLMSWVKWQETLR